MNGTLLIAGGNIGATDQGRWDIFGRFADLTGGSRGKVMVVVTASGDPAGSWEDSYRNLRLAGAGEVILLPLTENEEALAGDGWTDRADESLLPLFAGVTGVWFTGGDQLRTVGLLLQKDGSDTPVLKAIRRVLEGGGAVGGTSAGAAVMSRTMIVRGDDLGALTLPVCTRLEDYPDLEGETSPEQLLLLPGLGFMPKGVVDQHFNRRPRLQRLMAAMDAVGEKRGYGVSEDTALEVELADGTLHVHGSAYVLRVTRTENGMTVQKFTAADLPFSSKVK